MVQPQSFSFQEISAHSDAPLPDPVMVKASDLTKLAVRCYRPASQAKALLVFLHGGGAHSGAGYHVLAERMSRDHGIIVYTPDLRGHGKSAGTKGDSPNVEQVWKDVQTVLTFAKRQEESNGINAPLFLGGHSSGGGLVLNYATWAARKAHKDKDLFSTGFPDIAGYLLLSPELGYKSDTRRPGRVDFARVSVLPFIVNALTAGRCLGHSRAVQFNYPRELLQDDPSMSSFNTVNMATAITPENPKKQMEDMIDEKPVGLWVGEKDELFDTEKVRAYSLSSVVVPEANHLGIVVNAHLWLGPWIEERLSK